MEERSLSGLESERATEERRAHPLRLARSEFNLLRGVNLYCSCFLGIRLELKASDREGSVERIDGDEFEVEGF